MKNSLTNKNEQQEEKDGEENNDGGFASVETLNTSERCPICLNVLTLEVGFPEDCCHAFCVSCILKWSETSTSCPVDRKPFQAIYTTDPVGSWTKINVKERRPRENLSCTCDQTLTYCTKGKLGFRICEITEETSEIATPHKETKCMDYTEKPDMKIMSLNCPNCVTGDIATCPFDLSETAACFNRAEQEDSELYLIQHKREALKHLRIPLGAEGIPCGSSLPAEILIHPPYSLDECILPLSPISFRSNDYSHRMCAHTGPQEGTEKKQAASGTSTSRGTRKKSVQSNTRRRSTRNSKSDAHNVQSSPKSSSSDHDTPGNSNTTTTSNTSSSDHPGKPPAKQRKKAAKKGSQTRKRLRSATPPQEDSKDDNDDSESEQEKKCKMSEDDLPESELYKINQSPYSSSEKEYQHADLSSPLKHSEEEHVLESSPAHSVQSAEKERSSSPDLDNEHEFHMEHSSPSPVFNKNGQTDLEDSQTDFPKSVSEPGAVGAAEAKLDVEEKHSENLNVSDGENSSSSLESTKHISEHTDSPPLIDKVTEEDVEESLSLPSSPCSDIKPTKQNLQDLSSSEETDINAENHLHTGQVDLNSNESKLEIVGSSSTQSTPPLELVKQHDLDCKPTSPNALKEKGSPQPQNVQQLGLDDSLKTMQRQEEQEKVLEVNLQTAKPEESIVEQDSKRSFSSELDQSSESSNSAAEALSDIEEIQGNKVCKEDLESSLLGNGKIQDTNEKSDTNENDHPKVFSEDNNEPVAMECDSAGSDHNDSEAEQSVDITQTTKTESDTSTVSKIPESPPKSLPPGDTHKKESRTRRSRFHSPSTTWSPSKNDVKERQRSRSRSKVSDSPIKPKSRSRSREKDADRSHGDQWKGRSRDRHHRRHSRSRSRHSRSRSKHSRSRSRHSRSKSRSRSGSRTRHRNKSVTTDKNEKEKDCSSPPQKDKRANEKDTSSPPRKDRRANEKDTSSPPRKDRRANEKDIGSPPRKDRRANEKDTSSPPRKDRRANEKDISSPPRKDRRANEKDISSPPRKDRRANEKDCSSPPRKDKRANEKDCSSPPWKDRRSNEKDCSSPPWKDRRSNEKDCSSPPWKDRRANENWKSPRGSEKYRRNEHDRNENFRNEIHDARDSAEAYSDNKNDYPDWVMERMKSEDRGRGDTWMRGEFRGRGDRGWGDSRGRGDRARGRCDFRGRGENRGWGDRGRGARGRGSHWEDGPYGSGDSWNRNVNMDWNSPRSRGGRGRGGFRGGFNYGDQNENWNNRQPYSGNFNTPGQESSRFPESKNKPKYDDSFDSPADRSGWSSASSWAVRKTLPADVQNYYSKRGRNSTGSQGVWPKPEESQDQDQATKEQASQQTESTPVPVPVNMVHTQMNVVQQQIAPPPPQPPINMFPYPVGVHPPMVNIQHNPYNLHPQLPIHLHPALPLVQVSAPPSVPQGLPPPPPPPPPTQQISYIAPQQDGKPMQGNPGATYVSNNVNAPLLPAPAAVQGTVGVILGTVSGSVATSGHSKNLHASVKSATRKESVTVEASADSSKKEKKIQIQERAAQVVKGAIKQYYQNKDITKDEYKEIVKKAVDKVCHSKSGEVDSSKVANLVKAYVDKYKHSRKKGPDDKL